RVLRGPRLPPVRPRRGAAGPRPLLLRPPPPPRQGRRGGTGQGLQVPRRVRRRLTPAAPPAAEPGRLPLPPHDAREVRLPLPARVPSLSVFIFSSSPSHRSRTILPGSPCPRPRSETKMRTLPVLAVPAAAACALALWPACRGLDWSLAAEWLREQR